MIMLDIFLMLELFPSIVTVYPTITDAGPQSGLETIASDQESVVKKFPGIPDF